MFLQKHLFDPTLRTDGILWFEESERLESLSACLFDSIVMSTTIIAMRQSDLPVPGAVKSIGKKCGVCKEPVWVAYSSLVATANEPGELEICCNRCAPKMIEEARKHEEVDFLPPTEQALREVRDALRNKEEI